MTDTGVPCVCHCMSLHIRPECYKLHKGTGWDDAALFEARVAAKLADPYYPPMDVGSDGPQLFMPPADRMKWARIEVEKEMDAGNG